MSPETVIQGAVHIAGAIFTAGLVWGVLKTELRWHRRDIDRAQETADRAHVRIDSLQERHS
jgi:hypothetical protein